MRIEHLKTFRQCVKLKTLFWEMHPVFWYFFCRRQAPVAAVFAGSPQLMGVIKLCTGWMVSSLPLYNDDDLLKRNENVSIQFHKCILLVTYRLFHHVRLKCLTEMCGNTVNVKLQGRWACNIPQDRHICIALLCSPGHPAVQIICLGATPTTFEWHSKYYLFSSVYSLRWVKITISCKER